MATCVTYYRFVSGGRGIYEAVEFECPRNDRRRIGKPDGAWLPRVGTNYPGAISFWTEVGLRRYIGSGLQAWHASVVSAPVEVSTATNPSKLLYSDEFQIICMPDCISIKDTLAADVVVQSAQSFLEDKAPTAQSPASSVPSEQELDDHDLLTRFEGGQLTPGQWVHKTHVRVGYLFIRSHDFSEAFNRMRAGIKALNKVHGSVDTLTSGYHETLTGAWLRLIEATIRHQGPGKDSRDFCDNQPQLLCKRVLRFFYSTERIMSPEAKATFIDPDLAPFPK